MFGTCPAPPFRGGKQGGHHGFVEREEMLHPLPVRGEAGGAVEPVHRAVEGGVRGAEVRGHQVGIVEIGQRRAGMCCAGIEDGLGERVEFGEVLGGRMTLRNDAGPVPLPKSPIHRFFAEVFDNIKVTIVRKYDDIDARVSGIWHKHCLEA